MTHQLAQHANLDNAPSLDTLAAPSAVLGHACDQDEQPDPPVCTHQPVLCFHGGLPEFGEQDCCAPAVYLIDGDADRDCLHACQEHIAEELQLLNWVPSLQIWTVRATSA
jgi:hypothetical protein